MCYRQAQHIAAARLPDGRVVCAGGYNACHKVLSSAELFGQETLDASWVCAQLRVPAMNVPRSYCRGCVMSDGRFVVLGWFKINWRS